MGGDGIGVRCARFAEAVCAPRRPARTIVVAAIACVASSIVARELVSAYAAGALPSAALDLVLPPFASLLLYGPSPKAAIATAMSITVAAIGIAAFGFGAVPPTALDAVLLCTAAIVMPIVFDLVLVDVGRSLHCDPSDWRTALVVFVTALVVLLSSSRQQSQREARGDTTSHRLAPQATSGRAG